MKPTFKTTALSLLVALGVAACSSGGSGSNDSAGAKPQPQKNVDQLKPQPEKPKAEEPATQQQKPKAEESKPQPQQPKEDAKPQAGNKSNYVLDKKGKEWRSIRLSSISPLVSLSTDSPFPEGRDGLLSEYYDYIVNLDKLSGSKLGVHQGKINTENELAPKSDGSSIKNIQYLFENQPYSSYGILMADNGDAKAFAFGLKTGNSEHYPQYTISSITGGYIPSVLGTAVYKGQVISTILEDKDGKYTRFAPKVDGAITLTANFTKDDEYSNISGEVTSERLGKTIKLYSSKITSIGGNTTAVGDARIVGDSNFKTGGYYIGIHGPNAEEAVGEINLHNDNIDYQAVFGAQKQPK